MDGVKAWYQSRTVWGAIIAVLAPCLQLADLPISREMQSELADDIVAVVGAVGGLIALGGRLFASSQLK